MKKYKNKTTYDNYIEIQRLNNNLKSNPQYVIYFNLQQLYF